MEWTEKKSWVSDDYRYMILDVGDALVLFFGDTDEGEQDVIATTLDRDVKKMMALAEEHAKETLKK